MFPTELPRINAYEFSRCKERRHMADHGKKLDSIQKTDAATKEHVYNALWKDDVLRALEYYEVDVHVKNGIVYLYGHLASANSLNRIKNVIQSIPGIGGIINNLVLDDKLTLEVATSLGQLEHTYACKFFTGTSHGVVTLNGTVGEQIVKTLAEKCAADNPKVRGVVNNVRVLEVEPEAQNQPFLQPTKGETIYFLNGVSGVVQQVVINPDNRRVTAMTIQGNFNEQRNELHPLADGKAGPPEQLIVVPMKTVRYLTKVSGFLNINSHERNQYQDFDPASFYAPNWDWTPPYPYCPDDVLFPIEHRTTDIQIAYGFRQFPIEEILEGASFKEQFFANDSLGG